MSLQENVALVTGGSRGIGLAVARELGQAGYRLAILATRPENFYPESMKYLQEAEVTYHWFSGDIGSSEDRRRIVREVAESLGEIHVLVNNAGVAPKIRADLLDMTEESYDYVMDINTKGNMFMTQLVANQMCRQPVYGSKRGTIINISSCSSEVSSVNRGEYCISKAGISMLTKLYADRLASERIYVYEIRPGVIRTDMTAAVEEKYEKLIQQGVFPIARWGLPEDVAKAVRAFCSDDFCYTTGSAIDVDGGFHIRRL